MKNLFKTIIALVLLCITYSGFTQTPIYNSYPTATATIFLDFDGHNVSGTSWNMNGDIPAAASNLTITQMTEIFNRVSEDYRPFNVNITTDSTKYQSAPVYQRMRVILTTSSSWYGSAGGVSYIGSYSWGDNTPCFVFTALLNYNTKNIAEATAHEVGHTLGLHHQAAYNSSCVKTAEYNAGVGGGEIGWAPIMGNGYYRNMTLWNNGAMPYGCNIIQDDLAIITYNFGYRTDDHANDAATATVASFVGNQFTLSGVVERTTDVDLIQVNIPSIGSFHLDATPYNVSSGFSGSNLDMQIELLSSDQTVLSTYNPATLVKATVDTMLNGGTYYLRVKGKGNIYAPEYASLGSYNLSGTFIESTVLPLHKLELTGSIENNKHKFNWIIEADETITGQTLEVSSNGRNYHSVGSLNNSNRSFNYTPLTSGVLYYRLKINLNNRTDHYSNVITLRSNAEKFKPVITSNLVDNSVSVNSPSSYAYSITDYSGRAVAKGALNQGMNKINTSSLSRGMYIIQFSNGQELYAEKFMKQ